VGPISSYLLFMDVEHDYLASFTPNCKSCNSGKYIGPSVRSILEASPGQQGRTSRFTPSGPSALPRRRRAQASCPLRAPYPSTRQYDKRAFDARARALPGIANAATAKRRRHVYPDNLVDCWAISNSRSGKIGAILALSSNI
jgi:hypothetical protein